MYIIIISTLYVHYTYPVNLYCYIYIYICVQTISQQGSAWNPGPCAETHNHLWIHRSIGAPPIDAIDPLDETEKTKPAICKA